MERTKRTAPEEYAAAAEAALKQLVLRRLPDAEVWLFGSRATGTANRRSDFDVAYLPGEGFDHSRIVRLREEIEESGIIYRVDLVDLSEAEVEFRERVAREGISWRS